MTEAMTVSDWEEFVEEHGYPPNWRPDHYDRPSGNLEE